MGDMSMKKKNLLLSGVASVALLALGHPAHAFDYQFDNGVDVRFDNTLQYSVVERVAPFNPEVGGPKVNAGNTNDGDDSLRSGIVSNRVDLLSKFDISDNGFGFDTTIDSFYDTVYNQKTQSTNGSTYNPASTPASKFTSETVTQAGRNIELRNLFVYGSGNLGPVPVTLRVGRFVNQFGESLLFAANGIAAGQSPIDIERASSVPNTQAKNLFLPVGQASLSVQLTPTIAVSAYYQFEWESELLAPVGSYFSFTDVLGAGAQRIYAASASPYISAAKPGSALYFYRAKDMSGSNTGQFGGSLHWNPNNTTADFGLYGLQFNNTAPTIYTYVNPTGPKPVAGTAAGSPAALALGTYRVVYADGIQIFGASSSATYGPVNFAGEVSIRTNENLNSSVSVAPGEQANNSNHALYAIGNTLHYQVSEIYLGPKTSFWDSSSVIGEAAADSLLSITKNEENYDRAESGHMAEGLRTIGSVTYFEVLPGLEVTPSIGLGWNFSGRAPDTIVFNSTGIDRGGDLTIGVSGIYLNKWTGGFSYTRYIAPPARDPAADRDFVSFNVERTF